MEKVQAPQQNEILTINCIIIGFMSLNSFKTIFCFCFYILAEIN